MAGDTSGDSKTRLLTSAAEIRHLIGPVTDDTIAAIIRLVATSADLEIAASYLQGKGDEMDRLGHPMAGKVAQLYDILATDDLYETDDG